MKRADEAQTAFSPAVMVFITGLSCTGKTTLARAISERFSLPLFGKDRFKEMMFDSACPEGDYENTITRELSRHYGQVSLQCLEIALEECARSATHAVFEANFDSQLFSPRLALLRQQFFFQVIQVHLRCRGDVLVERFIQREQTQRHPGHGGLRHLDAVRPVLLRGSDEPLAMQDGDDLLDIDTTDLASVDYTPLFARIADRVAIPGECA